MSNVNFTRQLVKGKIAETVFCQMFRESGNFTIWSLVMRRLFPI